MDISISVTVFPIRPAAPVTSIVFIKILLSDANFLKQAKVHTSILIIIITYPTEKSIVFLRSFFNFVLTRRKI